jgi:epoxyqueuosine reductase
MAKWIIWRRHAPCRGNKRALPAELVPGTRSIITARMNYRPAAADSGTRWPTARAPSSRATRWAATTTSCCGRLQKLADRIGEEIGPFAYRAFTDSAPVMEVGLARTAGWAGAASTRCCSIARRARISSSASCSPTCRWRPTRRSPTTAAPARACIDACPTRAIVAPYRLDARLCISYLTIELKGAFPSPCAADGQPHLRLRRLPAGLPVEPLRAPDARGDFAPRHGLDRATLVELFAWEESEFEERLAGSPIRRIGHERWLRNIAVALGNAPRSDGRAQRPALTRRTIPQQWCASTSPGRCVAMENRASRRDRARGIGAPLAPGTRIQLRTGKAGQFHGQQVVAGGHTGTALLHDLVAGRPPAARRIRRAVPRAGLKKQPASSRLSK